MNSKVGCVKMRFLSSMELSLEYQWFTYIYCCVRKITKIFNDIVAFSIAFKDFQNMFICLNCDNVKRSILILGVKRCEFIICFMTNSKHKFCIFSQ